MIWLRLNSKWYFRSGYGSVVKTAAGWVGSASGYQDVILKPNVGPFKKATEAMVENEKLLKGRI